MEEMSQWSITGSMAKAGAVLECKFGLIRKGFEKRECTDDEEGTDADEGKLLVHALTDVAQ